MAEEEESRVDRDGMRASGLKSLLLISSVAQSDEDRGFIRGNGDEDGEEVEPMEASFFMSTEEENFSSLFVSPKFGTERLCFSRDHGWPVPFNLDPDKLMFPLELVLRLRRLNEFRWLMVYGDSWSSSSPSVLSSS